MLTLSPEDLQSLTRRERSDAQARELANLGIPFKTRRDGSLVVLTAVVELLFGATITAQSEPELRP